MGAPEARSGLRRGGEYVKRSHRILTLLTASTSALLATATPALAQYEYTGDEGLAFGIVCCYGFVLLFGLAFLGFWIWMLIDSIQRQEYEYPNSSGNTKTIWLVILLASWVISAYWIAALAYYFMVYRKIKRGTMQPPTTGGGYAPPGGGSAPPPPSSGAGTPPPPPPGGGAPPPPPQ
jgi:hypothetical protein